VSKIDKGTSVRLYFPVSREIMKETDNINLGDYRGDREKILVVDDIEIQREVAKTILEHQNYIVETVSSGEEAIEYVKKNSVDLLLLDMIMDPGIDGCETYCEIVKNNPKQKAVIASGYSESERVKKAQIMGAGTYIQKPYEAKTLSIAIFNEINKKI